MGMRDQLAAKVMYAAMIELSLTGEMIPLKELKFRIGHSCDFTSWEMHVLGTGETRWESVMHWYSHEYVKAGYITKHGQNGWKITELGLAILIENQENVFDMVREIYKSHKWVRPPK